MTQTTFEQLRQDVVDYLNYEHGEIDEDEDDVAHRQWSTDILFRATVAFLDRRFYDARRIIEVEGNWLVEDTLVPFLEYIALKDES